MKNSSATRALGTYPVDAMCLRALDTNEPLDRFLEIKAEIAALEEELEGLNPMITYTLWEEPEHRTLYQGCKIALSTRMTYEYSYQIKAHEKALREAKQVERLTGRAKMVRATSFPVITPMKMETACKWISLTLSLTRWENKNP